MAGKEYQIVSQPGYTVDYTKKNLIQLVRDGYGVNHANVQETLLTQVQSYEYRNADKVYFALNKNESEIGSLSVKIRTNIEHDPFWQALQSVLQQDVDKNFLACEIYGIVVHPQARREGVATRLLSKMIEDRNPQIIFGQTNVPKVVLLRTKVTNLYGYRTFYGFCEVTPDVGYKREHDGKPFIQASLISQEAEPSQEGVYFISTHIVPPNIPNTKNFPLEIQRALDPVRNAQKAMGREQTAVTTLVSVQDRIFEKKLSFYAT